MAVSPNSSNELLDVAGAAEHLGVTESFVRRIVLERRVRYYKVGKFVRFRAQDLDEFVEAGRQEPVFVRVTGSMSGSRSRRLPLGLPAVRRPRSTGSAHR